MKHCQVGTLIFPIQSPRIRSRTECRIVVPFFIPSYFTDRDKSLIGYLEHGSNLFEFLLSFAKFFISTASLFFLCEILLRFETSTIAQVTSQYFVLPNNKHESNWLNHSDLILGLGL